MQANHSGLVEAPAADRLVMVVAHRFRQRSTSTHRLMRDEDERMSEDLMREVEVTADLDNDRWKPELDEVCHSRLCQVSSLTTIRP